MASKTETLEEHKTANEEAKVRVMYVCMLLLNLITCIWTIDKRYLRWFIRPIDWVILYIANHYAKDCTDSQSSLEAGKKELDEQKVALRERNKELSRCEQERKEREKEKVSCALKIKELEHKITKFHKDSRDAAQRVMAKSQLY